MANQNDIRKVFQEALFKPPENLVDLLNKLEKKKFVAVHLEKKDELKTWYITQEGLEYISSGFQNGGDKK